MNTIREDRFYDTEVPFIKCIGTPREIGLAHGSGAKDRISKCIAIYTELYKLTAGIDWDEAKEKAAKFKPYIQQHFPDLIEEMEGIAEGANRDVLDILTLNFRSEIVLTNYSDGCTSIATYNEELDETYVGQNWDWIPEMKAGSVVLDIQKKNCPRIILCTEAGIIGKSGFNGDGVGLVLNALKCGKMALKLPIHCLLRLALESSSVDEVEKLFFEYGCASCANVMVADRSNCLKSFEITPLGVAVIEPTGGVVLHTNHLFADVRFVQDFPSPNSFSRLERIRELSKDAPHTIASMRERFSDLDNEPYSICRAFIPGAVGVESMITLMTIIMNVSRNEGEVSYGRPAENPKVYRLFFD
ncbi:unnamed protein product [Kuraishia capsulata CBS 1993]|uniref:Peptidase C45 hydrolase domain-containing protein n=1 Tax=Kuraishia capsulata CBS 1993 TaxID=1382522 RepID=W6MJW7_9ASCO|nr:uncharacterized protein KUCA_T00002559001 [Kuraishia capsulata CBS 1993]CDK26586.1 unnamed protein product [Kuraishia capsulata CBS 1993]